MKKEAHTNFREELNKELNQSPQEVPSSSMTTMKNNFSMLWRPNNYRRQINVKTKDNSTIENIKSAISAIDFNFNAHTKLISVHNFDGITIQYGKNTLTGIYSQNKIGGVKEIYHIEAPTIEDIEERIDEKKDKIQNKIDAALKKFTKRFKINVPYSRIVWSRYEDFIKGDDYIDKIPREVIIHDTHFKKVYGKGIEFIPNEIGQKPTVKLKNYIKNRAIENIAPEIAEELSTTRKMVEDTIAMNKSSSEVMNQFVKSYTEQSKIFDELAIHIKTHNKVIKGMSKAIDRFNTKLEQRRLQEYL